MKDETPPANWTYERALDASGLQCPLPVLKARKALLAMPAGARLLVTATDPVAAIDMPHFAGEAGHRIVATGKDGATLMFLIERGPDRPG